MVGLTLVLPLLPYYATEFGANALVVGVLISAFSLAQLLCAPLWGGISDRHGRRPVILFGLATTSVAYVIFGFAHSVALLLISRVIQGIGGGTIGVVQAYVADASPPEERTKSLGWLTAVTSLGALVGPAFGSVLDQLAGRSAPGLAAAGLAIVTAAFALRYLPESQGARGEPAAPEPKVTGRDALRGVLARWREPASRLIWIYTIAIGAFYGTAGIFPLLLKARLGVTEHTIGYFFMYFGGMGVIVRAGILGRAVDRFGEARVARIGIGLLAGGLALFALAHSWPAVAVAMTLMPLGTAFLFPCVTGLLSRVVSATNRGLYMGVQQTYGGVSRVAFPILAGWVMDHLGNGVPFGISAGLVLLTIPLTGAMHTYARLEDARPAAP
jgi:multidrug resistance protein